MLGCENTVQFCCTSAVEYLFGRSDNCRFRALRIPKQDPLSFMSNHNDAFPRPIFKRWVVLPIIGAVAAFMLCRLIPGAPSFPRDIMAAWLTEILIHVWSVILPSFSPLRTGIKPLLLSKYFEQNGGEQSDTAFRRRIALALLALHTSAILYILLVPVLVLFFHVHEDPECPNLVALGIFCVLSALGVEVVAFGLRRHRFWAWIASLCIFGLYVPSFFLPIGTLGLWLLLNRATRDAFTAAKANE
jgi:hypothetical protein